jgi:hypothetical protein
VRFRSQRYLIAAGFVEKKAIITSDPAKRENAAVKGLCIICKFATEVKLTD